MGRRQLRIMLGTSHRLASLFISTCLVVTGCVHKIHVAPVSPETAPAPFPSSVQLDVPFLAIEGADHMPGIPLLEWSSTDLREAITEYFSQRQTFVSIGPAPGGMRLVVKAWLTLRAPDRYLYRVHLESELSFSGQAAVKTYAAEGEALGSSVRWVTASDQVPIAAATAQALHQLATQIEEDRELVRKGTTQ